MESQSKLNESDASSISSSSVVTCPSFDSSHYATLQHSVTKTIKSRVFLGRYVERRLVNEALGYRDVVLVSLAEEELQRDLLEVSRSLAKCYPATHWVGITDREFLPEYKAEVTIWTEIDNKPFGAFWFQIKSVQFRMNEVIITVKCLRHITDRFLELEPFLVCVGRGAGRYDCRNDSDSTTIVAESIDFQELAKNLKNGITLKNVKEGVFFIIALFIALITGSFAFVSYFGNFVLSLVRELSNLVHSSTPLVLGSLDIVSKIIGGFYILLAMIFKQTTPARGPSRQLEYVDKRHQKHSYNDNEDLDYD